MEYFFGVENSLMLFSDEWRHKIFGLENMEKKVMEEPYVDTDHEFELLLFALNPITVTIQDVMH